MRKKYAALPVFIELLFILPLISFGQSPSSVKEYKKIFATYPFSDPDPVATPTHIYPYFRFDGFAGTSIQQKWDVVALENDFIKVIIMPQIGGKIWTAIDKKNGKPFIYDNDAVKFRDIALRGPWTSGGLEANFGIFGHTPGVATPVDYITQQNSDGSASCTIGLLDLLTQTHWSMEILLPKDKAYFLTKIIWHNGSGIDQPYYSWMNLGEKVADSLEYVEPGNYYLGHDGSLHSWPFDEKNHKQISIYAQNDFGSYKSYHVTGIYSKYFGTFWQKENYGMIHYAERGDKIGKKVWIWGLSKQGMIWEKLLTDSSGQYSELQSGRMYNQNAPESVLSPFKQISFFPYNTDIWNEYWYPYQNTEGVVSADLNGVINIKQNNGVATIFISPVSYINDTLKVWDKKGKILLKQKVSLLPLQSFQQKIPLKNTTTIGRIILAGSEINMLDSTAKQLSRPLTAFKNFNWNSAYGFYVKGHYQTGQHYYAEAEKNIMASLQKEPSFMPALTEMSLLQYRKLNYDSAFYFARLALSIDTYNPKANYYYAIAALKLNKWYDAEDGFQVATITPQYRTAAYTELSKMQLQKSNYLQAFEDASKALIANANNITALQLQCVSARLMHKKKVAVMLRKLISSIDPLNDFVRFEQYWENKNVTTKNAFTSLIRSELPQQTYLALAIWYNQLNLPEESKTILEIAPQKDDEMLYWQAWLNRNNASKEILLAKANAGTAQMVFPFRQQSAVVMKWAIENTDNWKPVYYQALILASRNQKGKAMQLLKMVSDTVNFGPLYITRAQLRDPTDTVSILNDYKRAVSLNTGDWRYLKYLTKYLITRQKNEEALQTIEDYSKQHPDNYIAGLLYIRCLTLNNNYEAAEKFLNKINVLPFEGASDGHSFYEQTKLMLALQAYQKQNYKVALQKVQEALLWPENLGAGAPYPSDINHKLEDEITQLIQIRKKLSREDIIHFKTRITALGKSTDR